MRKKQILLINDIAGYGKVATAAMLPILSYFGYPVYNLPTALVSNTLDYGKFRILETTDYIEDVFPIWKELGFHYDSIATGFIASERQAKLISAYCREQAANGTMIFVDPIMGDNGKLYNGVTPSTINSMREMLSVADLCFPNYTEACYLTDSEYRVDGVTKEEGIELLKKLRTIGTKSALITSISIDGQSFLVTCPINRYSYALSNVVHPFSQTYCALQPKSAQARKLVKQLVNSKKNTSICPPVYVRSDIIQGKGMASSSADISVTAMATALAMDYELSFKELEQICLSVEPTDASFYQGVTQFDYIKGTISQPLGMCPPLKILVFDEGGSIDTVSFNKQADLQNKILEKESIIRESLEFFKHGLITHDIKLIGQAATLSAFGNQRILYKPNLYDFHDIGNYYNSVGTIIAHSGTIMGLLFPVDYGRIDDCKNEIIRKLPQLSYVDTVETTNEGLTYIKR